MHKAGFTALFLAFFALGALFSAPSVEAASNCTYYSDASHTTVVGKFGYDCCNNKISWGSKTQYSVCGACFICYPPPIE